MSTMYSRIEALCASRGTNVTAMCRELAISRSALTELKSGRSKSLNADTAAAIAKYLGTTLDYIVGLTDHPAPPQPSGDGLEEYVEMLRTRPELKIFLKLVEGATKEEAATAVRVVEALIKSERDAGADE